MHLNIELHKIWAIGSGVNLVTFLCKSLDWFLYGRDPRHERVNSSTVLRFECVCGPPTKWKNSKKIKQGGQRELCVALVL